MNGLSNHLRWNHYVLEHGADLKAFWCRHLAEKERRILFVLVKGFDPRMCLGLEMLLNEQHTGRCDVALIEYDEGVNSSSHEHRPLLETNLSHLKSLVAGRGELQSLPIPPGFLCSPSFP